MTTGDPVDLPARGPAAWIVPMAIWTIALAGPVSAESPSSGLDRMKRDTQALSSDAFEGRGPMTAGETKSVAYIVSGMKRAGLKPGFNGSFTQTVPMLQAETLTATPPRMSISGLRHTVEFAYQKDVTLNTRRHLSRVVVKNSPVIFVGYGINAPERHWNDYAGVDVRGKTVLILINDPDWRQPAGKGPFGGAAMTYYGRWMYKYEEAARQGAAAAIIIHRDDSAGYPFSVPASSLGGARVSLRHPGKDILRVESWMTHDAARRLVEASGQDLARLEAAAGQPGFRARPLDATANIDFRVRIRTGVSRNVLGLLPGRERPGEYVVYSAHWDHLGHCPPDASGDDICNGAIDNASGVAGLLELARQFAPARPRRSLLFLATTGEEYGLLGSQYYMMHPARPLSRTVADIDLDPLSFMLGRTRDVALIADQTELAAIVRSAAAAQGRVMTADPAPSLGNRYRSDTLSFSRGGVPAVVLGPGTDAEGRPAGWASQKLTDYYDRRYHQPSDAYDPAWDWSGALQDLELVFDIGSRLANGSDWPNWFANDEFRPARDRVRAKASEGSR